MATNSQSIKEGIEELKNGIESFVAPVDIFILALARTKITKFSNDINDWHRAIYEICEKYQGEGPGKIPELRPIFFELRPPLPPMTDAVYELISSMGICGYIWWGNSQREPYTIEPSMKKAIKKLEAKRLSHYISQIKEMSRIFEKHLRIED